MAVLVDVGEEVRVAVTVGVAVLVAVGVNVNVGVGVKVGTCVDVGVAVGVFVPVGVVVNVADGVGDGVLVPVGDGLADAVTLGVGVAVGTSVSVAVGSGVKLGAGVTVCGSAVGDGSTSPQSITKSARTSSPATTVTNWYHVAGLYGVQTGGYSCESSQICQVIPGVLSTNQKSPLMLVVVVSDVPAWTVTLWNGSPFRLATRPTMSPVGGSGVTGVCVGQTGVVVGSSTGAGGDAAEIAAGLLAACACRNCGRNSRNSSKTTIKSARLIGVSFLLSHVSFVDYVGKL